MTDATSTKVCKMCYMEIPSQARKCPYCHHFQTRLAMMTLHPAFSIGFVMILWLGMAAAISKMFDRGENYQHYSDQIAITESKMLSGEIRGAPTVVVLGTITNKSPVPWKDIQFQVDVRDSSGQRVDTSQVEPYSYVLPARDTLSFKVSFRREFPEKNYVSHVIRVVSAKDDRARW